MKKSVSSSLRNLQRLPTLPNMKCSPEHEEHGVVDDSEEASESPFMLECGACLLPVQDVRSVRESSVNRVRPFIF